MEAERDSSDLILFGIWQKFHMQLTKSKRFTQRHHRYHTKQKRASLSGKQTTQCLHKTLALGLSIIEIAMSTLMYCLRSSGEVRSRCFRGAKAIVSSLGVPRNPSCLRLASTIRLSNNPANKSPVSCEYVACDFAMVLPKAVS